MCPGRKGSWRHPVPCPRLRGSCDRAFAACRWQVAGRRVTPPAACGWCHRAWTESSWLGHARPPPSWPVAAGGLPGVSVDGGLRNAFLPSTDVIVRLSLLLRPVRVLWGSRTFHLSRPS